MKLTKTLDFAGVQFKGDANGLIELASAIKKSANQISHAINWAVHSALVLTDKLPQDESASYEVVFNKKLKESDRYLNSELPVFSSWEAEKATAFPAKVSPKRVESLVSSFQKRAQAFKSLDPESKGKLDLEEEKAELIAALMEAYQVLTGGKVATTGLTEELDSVKLTIAEQGAEELKASEVA